MLDLRVLHVYKRSALCSLGGVESFIDSLCSLTSGMGVSNVLLSISPSPSKDAVTINGCTVYEAKESLFLASTAFSLEAFGLFRSLVKEADIIHYHYPDPFADCLHLSFNHGKPSVVTYHSDIIRQKCLSILYSPLKKIFLDSVSCIVATSPNYFKTSKELQKYKPKVKVISLGVEVEKYEDAEQRRVSHWKSLYGDDFFLFVGVARYYKGLHIALDAVKGTGYKFIVAGEGGITDELKARVSSECIGDVEFVGRVSEEDKLALLHACGCFVFPSHMRSEAFGLALVEAAASGKPMISCEIGTGTSFVNEHQVTGLVVPPSDVGALREAMGVMINDPCKASGFGVNARERARKFFNMSRVAVEYLKVYEEIIDKK